MSKYAIQIQYLTKIYRLYNKPQDRLKESLSLTRKKYHTDFYAIDNLSIRVLQNSTIGIIGTNGSGKSTLLKIIAGVLNPTSGSVQVNGRVSALLELGAGFNPEYTGLENIYLSGTIMGYSKEEIEQKVGDIVEFANIGEFIKQPVKSYSSGMFARLAFSVAISVNPDILIVDEALSVGDVRFQQKCFREMEKFKKEKTILLVTHDLGVITKFCEKTLWIEKGKFMDFGDSQEIGKKYQAYLQDAKLEKVSSSKQEITTKGQFQLEQIPVSAEDFGDKESEILGIGLFDAKSGLRLEFVYPNTDVSIIVRVHHKNSLYQGVVGFTVKDRLGNIVFQTNSFVLDCPLDEEIGVKDYCFTFQMPSLNEGNYTISPAVASGTMDTHSTTHWIHDALLFNVLNTAPYYLQGFLKIQDIMFTQL